VTNKEIIIYTSSEDVAMELKTNTLKIYTILTTLESSKFTASFRGTRRLSSAFMTLRQFRLAHISFQVTSLHKGDEILSISKCFLIGNRFHVILRILSPEI